MPSTNSFSWSKRERPSSMVFKMLQCEIIFLEQKHVHGSREYFLQTAANTVLEQARLQRKIGVGHAPLVNRSRYVRLFSAHQDWRNFIGHANTKDTQHTPDQSFTPRHDKLVRICHGTHASFQPPRDGRHFIGHANIKTHTNTNTSAPEPCFRQPRSPPTPRPPP